MVFYFCLVFAFLLTDTFLHLFKKKVAYISLFGLIVVYLNPKTK